MSWYDWLNPVHDVTYAAEQLDPQLQSLKSKYSRLKNQYNNLRSSVLNYHSTFAATLRDYKGYVAYNGALMITPTVLKMNENQFDSYLEAVKEPPPSVNPTNALPADVVQNIFKATGKTKYVINGIYNL